MADFFGVDATIVGYLDVVKALGKYDKNAKKSMQSSIRKAADLVISAARQDIPSTLLSHWRVTPPATTRSGSRGDKGWPVWDVNAMRQQIKLSFRAGRARGYGAARVRTAIAVRSMHPSAVIYEFARRSNPRSFVAAMTPRPGGRLIWKAFDDNAPRIHSEISTALSSANANLQAAVFAAKDRSR